VTGSSVYLESDAGLCVRVLRYAVHGGSSAWSACCCCLFAQLAQLCVCVCVRARAHRYIVRLCRVFDSLQREKSRSWCAACLHFSVVACVTAYGSADKYIVIASSHLACGTVLWSGESIPSARVRKVAFSMHCSGISIALSVAQESTAAQCIPVACHFVVRRWLV
jgi:hypothetical protein